MPIQETITANVGGTLQALDQVRGKMDALTRSTDRANRAANEQQRALRDRLGNASKLGAGAGGSFGGNVGRFSQVGAMGGGFGALGVGVVALGVGFRALGQIIQSRIEDEKKAIQIGQQMRKINEDAARKVSASGLRGVGQVDGIRELIARGGTLNEARGTADRLGISDAEAISGESKLRLLPPDVQNAVRFAAERAQQTGLGGFGQTIDFLGQDKLAQREVKRDQYSDVGVAKAISRMTGQDIDANGVGRAGDRLGYSRESTGALDVQRMQNKSGRVDLSRVANGDALEAARQQLIENLVPGAVAMGEFNRQMDQTVDGMRQLEAATGSFAKFLLVMTGQETPTTQLLRFQRVQGQAIANADNNAPRGGR